MENSYFIKLTLVLYRMTDSFPKEEPLKFSIREKANSILGELSICYANNPIVLSRDQKNKIVTSILKNVEILQSYFSIAQEQNWTEKDYILVLSREYAKIAGGMKVETEKKVVIPAKKESKVKVSFEDVERKRCREILEMLQQKEPLQVKDLEPIFQGTSKRTLRRDFEYLLQQNLVRRVGDKSNTGYILR